MAFYSAPEVAHVRVDCLRHVPRPLKEYRFDQDGIGRARMPGLPNRQCFRASGAVLVGTKGTCNSVRSGGCNRRCAKEANDPAGFGDSIDTHVSFKRQTDPAAGDADHSLSAISSEAPDDGLTLVRSNHQVSIKTASGSAMYSICYIRRLDRSLAPPHSKGG